MDKKNNRHQVLKQLVKTDVSKRAYFFRCGPITDGKLSYVCVLFFTKLPIVTNTKLEGKPLIRPYCHCKNVYTYILQ